MTLRAHAALEPRRDFAVCSISPGHGDTWFFPFYSQLGAPWRRSARHTIPGPGQMTIGVCMVVQRWGALKRWSAPQPATHGWES